MLRGQAGDEMIPPRGRLDLLRETILAAPASRVTFLLLDFNTYRIFKLTVVVRNPLGNVARYYLYLNGDEVKARYWTQYLQAAGAGVAAARVNDPRIMDVMSGRRGYASLEIAIDPLTRARWIGSEVVDEVGVIDYFARGCAYNIAITNITQIDVVSENTATGLEDNAFDTGSIVRLYGLRP